MKNLKNKFRLKITALSPVHIGTGEVYEPTNFVIDDHYLYEFDEVLFLQALSLPDRQQLNQKLNDYMQIIDFYKNHKDLAKKIAYHKTKISKKVEDTYNKIRNKDNSKNKNLFEIQKTYKNPNTHKAVILGSSLKGMFDTVFKIYPQKVKENDKRQQLIISDFLMLQGDTQNGYSYRRHKNPTAEARSNIPQIVEIIDVNSSFIGSLSTQYSFEDIQDKMKEFFDADSRVNILFKITKHSFVTRIGKFSGKAFMVDNGEDVLNSYNKPVATHTLYEDGSPFGWIKIELIDETEYSDAMILVDERNKNYYADLHTRQTEIKETISKQKEEKLKNKRKQEDAKRLEQERINRESKEQEKRLASLSPFGLKIEQLKNAYPDKNINISTIVFQAIKKNEIDEFKEEALIFVKEKMIEEKIWDKQKKKSAFKRTQETKEMLKNIERSN
ncbi:MAG: RAMP superfamily CRISPR-associated protein [Sulfurimonas sp.]